MRQHHCDQLLRIISMRRQAHSVDHFDFIIWMIYCIDVYALLSASGTGMFVEVVLKQNMLPLPERCLLPDRPGQPQVICPEEQAHFLAIININQEIVLIALQVGRLGKALRTEASQRRFGGSAHVPGNVYNMERYSRIQNLHRLILDSKTKWRSQFPDYRTWLRSPENLPPRVFEWKEHVRYNILKLEALLTGTVISAIPRMYTLHAYQHVFRAVKRPRARYRRPDKCMLHRNPSRSQRNTFQRTIRHAVHRVPAIHGWLLHAESRGEGYRFEVHD